MGKQKNIVPLSKADRDFFQSFFEEYKHFIYHTAASYAAEAGDRDDLVQEAVIRLMKNISVLRQLTRCKTAYYIVITVRTTYIDMLRRKGDIHTLSLSDENEEAFAGLYAADLADRSEADLQARMAVKQLKQNLSRRDWLVLVGKTVMGYTHEELGQLLDMDPANVRMVLSRARAKARELLRLADWMEEG